MPCEPEEKLMLAVLEDAIYECIFKCVLSRNRRGKRIFNDAYNWIRATGWDGPFVFEIICETLKLNHHGIRDGVIRWVEDARQRKQRPGGVAIRKTPHAVSASPRTSVSKAA
ncbi:MAG: hypothetical protein A3C07_02275 [Candidatus Sungbacteria bacterium RIFCSPHIGHO2_02_FULL_47_11]|uniref:Uncharacterized protein n=1 Tax=Candidatus Sungbacteria bacterium RIFCSPHIGHO2_02_FULL_47_11 TaxID=1802270 RepID=A0A1G2KQJ3_9BACT|nr:MAG: hypothetical protein A3C07_02275 [Candidatus Sungbacteria bacterium RIFCSPHIGHO2_02_FULL_47_11]